MKRSPYAALALAAGLALTSCGDAETPAAAGLERAVAGSPTAPPGGHRWVGHNGVVVAVPDWWTTGDTDCRLPVEDTVYVESGGITNCAAPVPQVTYPEVSSLAVLDTRAPHGERIVTGLEPDGSVDGEDVLVGEECRWFVNAPCRTVVAVPSRGVAFALYVDDKDDIDPATIRDSLMLLPGGWTTVPLSVADGGWTPTWGAEPSVTRRYTDHLEQSGLAARVAEAQIPAGSTTGITADLPKGSLLEIDPGPGSPIREGGEVLVTVMPATPR